MPLLSDVDRNELEREFAKLDKPVKLLLFADKVDCDFCGLAQQILEELSGLSGKLILEIRDIKTDRQLAQDYRIARVPALALIRVEEIQTNGKSETIERDYGIRFYGVAAGFEFAALFSDILDVSVGDSGLTAKTRQALSQLDQPVHLQVFTTPT